MMTELPFELAIRPGSLLGFRSWADGRNFYRDAALEAAGFSILIRQPRTIKKEELCHSCKFAALYRLFRLRF